MSGLHQHSIACPYCGEHIDVLIDASVMQQNYIEDCQVCCCPIEFDVEVLPDGEILVAVNRDDE